MFEFIEKFRHYTSILQHFQYYDGRQDLYEKARNSSLTNNVQRKQYNK
jgi:hypothetical protein